MRAEEAPKLPEQAAELKRAAAQRVDREDEATAGSIVFINLTDASYQLGDGQLVHAGAGGGIRVRADAVDAWSLNAIPAPDA